ncbi:SGNH/GDSL hydrolase family protein [Candidatus Daviesbacteria bacterium]|nr:SGNH/GDSL hydrolase family protein [Candidatus Daviesbacteria bacterium]
MGIFSVCCLVTFSFFSFNPLLSLERTFAKPIYQIKKIFNSQTIAPKNSYTIVLVGDSMTDYLGSGHELKKYLKNYYPNKQIDIANFSVGSTNILTLPDRLQNLTNYNGRISEPILNTDFDLIIIESFGHNPIPQLSQHNEVMDQARQMIKQRQPWARVVLLATIAPHADRYAEGVANLTTEERREWAKERASYIKNHIDYAKSHKLPVIDARGGGNIDYINTNDFIHPSVTGIDFLSREIADFIFKNRILPL